MDKIRRLRKSKGFTMVEIIVVIVIIGVLAALIIPNVLQSSKPSAGKSYAKDAYYKTQSFMSRKKLKNDSALNLALGSGLTFFFDVTPRGMHMNGSTPDSGHYGIAYTGFVHDSDSLGDIPEKHLVDDLARDLCTSLPAPEFEGTLYVMVDAKYRVQAAYWTDGSFAEVDHKTFTDNCILETGVYACAYPTRLCQPEGAVTKMFVYS